jgi:hypothetical protein
MESTAEYGTGTCASLFWRPRGRPAPPLRDGWPISLCVDEKSQVQALDHTAPPLPMRSGQIERRTHDYKRNGAMPWAHILGEDVAHHDSSSKWDKRRVQTRKK